MTRSSLGLLHVIFHLFIPELWPLIYAKIWFSLNILRTNWQNFTKFYICIHIDKIYIGIVTQLFSHICTWVMALDLCLNFVSTQYLELIDRFHKILYMHTYWQDLRWDWHTSFFTHLYQNYGPWFTPECCLRIISWEQIYTSSPNFIYAFILTRSSFGLLHIIFRKFVPQFWPLI